jgi:hypothetical protein
MPFRMVPNTTGAGIFARALMRLALRI